MLVVQWHLKEPGVYMSRGDTHFASPTGRIFGETLGSTGFGLKILSLVYDPGPETQTSTPPNPTDPTATPQPQKS